MVFLITKKKKRDNFHMNREAYLEIFMCIHKILVISESCYKYWFFGTLSDKNFVYNIVLNLPNTWICAFL